MANGKQMQPWYPANDAEAEKASRGEVYQGKDGQNYQHQDMPKASPRNPPEPVADDGGPADPNASPTPHPQATSPAVSESGPSADDPGDPEGDSAPPSAENALSFRKAVSGGPTNPSYDSDKFDSTGINEKQDGIPGPRGVNRPGDVMSDEERAAVGVKQEEKLRKGMSSTHAIDSTGKPKGEFRTIPQGNDKHGARRPDKIDYSKPVNPVPPMVGPRGVGAPKDTFHKK